MVDVVVLTGRTGKEREAEYVQRVARETEHIPPETLAKSCPRPYGTCKHITKALLNTSLEICDSLQSPQDSCLAAVFAYLARF